MQRLILAAAYVALFVTYILLDQNLKPDSLTWLKSAVVAAMFVVGLVWVLLVRISRAEAVREARREAQLEAEQTRQILAEQSAKRAPAPEPQAAKS
ncbi:MAG: hypothetical protein HS108_05425 [Planctomycetes bacterium]|jgi:hypothetical protein|nr:hypothetical protein [Planctomycetota bacterium]MCL4730681.1 hypothetical protein [Planctomycetota bacterium]